MWIRFRRRTFWQVILLILVLGCFFIYLRTGDEKKSNNNSGGIVVGTSGGGGNIDIRTPPPPTVGAEKVLFTTPTPSHSGRPSDEVESSLVEKKRSVELRDSGEDNESGSPFSSSSSSSCDPADLRYLQHYSNKEYRWIFSSSSSARRGGGEEERKRESRSQNDDDQWDWWCPEAFQDGRLPRSKTVADITTTVVTKEGGNKTTNVITQKRRPFKWHREMIADSESPLGLVGTGDYLRRRLRGKKIIFLGDSLARNLFVMATAKMCNEGQQDRCAARMHVSDERGYDEDVKGPWGCRSKSHPEWSGGASGDNTRCIAGPDAGAGNPVWSKGLLVNLTNENGPVVHQRHRTIRRTTHGANASSEVIETVAANSRTARAAAALDLIPPLDVLTFPSNSAQDWFGVGRSLLEGEGNSEEVPPTLNPRFKGDSTRQARKIMERGNTTDMVHFRIQLPRHITMLVDYIQDLDEQAEKRGLSEVPPRRWYRKGEDEHTTPGQTDDPHLVQRGVSAFVIALGPHIDPDDLDAEPNQIPDAVIQLRRMLDRKEEKIATREKKEKGLGKGSKHTRRTPIIVLEMPPVAEKSTGALRREVYKSTLYAKWKKLLDPWDIVLVPIRHITEHRKVIDEFEDWRAEEKEAARRMMKAEKEEEDGSGKPHSILSSSPSSSSSSPYLNYRCGYYDLVHPATRCWEAVTNLALVALMTKLEPF